MNTTKLSANTTKQPECWDTDANAHALRITTTQGRALLLPFDQFAFAEYEAEDKEQRLRLVFATHEVVLRGHALRQIEKAIQRMELSDLVCLQPSYRRLVPNDQPFILEIAVAEVTDAKAISAKSSE